jgi:hypothetical protein
MPVEFKQDSIKEWVINNLEEGQVAEVVLHGCSGGVVSELIYYADSCAFYEKYKEEIWQRLYNSAQDCDEHQNCLHYTSTFNGGCDVASDDQFRNLLAWWACEDVCREIIADKEADEEAQADSLVST